MDYQSIIPKLQHDIAYIPINMPKPTIERFQGHSITCITGEHLQELSYTAFHHINHYLRSSHLQQLRMILDDQEASPNDRYVAFELLKNANISAGGIFPMCQDTGTAIIMGKKGRFIWSDCDDEHYLAHGVLQCYQRHNLRYSQLAPLTMFEEVNTKNNLPAQIDIMYDNGSEYHFLFMAKGGGSANKSFLYQTPPSTLEETFLLQFIEEKLRTLGTSACPPYHLAVVIGGTSAEFNLKIVKLASARYLDSLPSHGNHHGVAFRDSALETRIHLMTQQLGIGAQFGGKYFCHDVRVIRLPRHGASLPIGIGVSCSADRQALGKITKDGVFLEQLEQNPAQFMPDVSHYIPQDNVVDINLNQPMSKILEQLRQCPVKTRVALSGTMIVARDLVHRKIREQLAKGQAIPDYFKNHPIYYAGPAKKPEGYASGAFGPTTAGRMDSYVDEFQSHGGSMIMLAKGNRSSVVKNACKKYGGFYLGSIGGPAARLGRDNITNVEVLDYEELGMEAVWRITVDKMPAFVVIDHLGNDFFEGLTT